VSFELILACGVLVLLVCFAAYAGFTHLFRLISTLQMQIDVAFKETNEKVNNPVVNLDGIKNDMLGMVEDVISNMQPPTAGDHLMGALTQFLQMKLMGSMGVDLNQLQSQLMPHEEEV
jgi:hypothetical protein